MPSMADPYAKVSWAKKHLDTLGREVRAFCTAAPPKAYTVTRHDDVERQKHVIVMEFHDVPPEICLVAGDAIYNMRAALDQTVWNLAALKGPPGRTQFPIIEALTRDAFKRFADDLFGIPDDAFTIIKTLQPYHAGGASKGHALWRLNEICNIDKHRRIPARGIEVTGVSTGLDAPDATSEILYNRHIMTVPLAHKDVRFNPGDSVEVVFGGGDSGISENFAGLMHIYNFVAKEVLPKFDRFFP